MGRTLLMLLFMLCVALMSLVLIPVACLKGIKDKKKREAFSFAFVKWSTGVLRSISGADIKYIGLENLAANDEAAVYIGNHRGTFDIVFLYPIMNGPTGFVAKSNMRTWPVVSWWMGYVNCLFIDRSNPKEGLKTIIAGIKNIKGGTSMVIFPEGTRSKVEGEMLDFKPGSFKLATKPGVKIIPVAINNTSQVFEDHVPFVKKTKAAIEICEPIETKGLSADEIKELPDKVHAIIEEKVKTNGKMIGSLQ